MGELCSGRFDTSPLEDARSVEEEGNGTALPDPWDWGEDFDGRINISLEEGS